MALNFPSRVVAETWEAAPMNLAVGPSLLGTEQIVATLADKWTARLKVRIKHGGISAFRAWRTTRRGRLIADPVGPMRVRAGSANGSSFGAVVLHSDGTAHSDGAGYSQGYTAAAAAAAGATRLTVTAVGAAAQFDAGRFFGIGARLYQITGLIGASSSEARFDFWPPLRAAVAAGAGFDWPPQTSMRLDSDDAGDVGDNATGAIDVTLDLIEVL